MIKLSRTREKYGAFSNFYPRSILVHGKTWPSVEHYYQAMKTDDQNRQELIRKASRPAKAAELGRDPAYPPKPEWEKLRLSVMWEALCCKFTQHDDFNRLLLGTGNEELVEYSQRDTFWGDGGDGSGHNYLGKMLMRLRTCLQDNRNGDTNESAF